MRTAVFDTINSLKPYFFSLREVSGNVSLDIKIPLQWSFKDGTLNTNIQCKVQDENSGHRLLSFVAPSTKEGYDEVFTTVKKIIKNNLEEEEKLKLFNSTVDSLKDLFLNSSLDKLREITFLKDEIQHKQGSRKTQSGNDEGPREDGTSQAEND